MNATRSTQLLPVVLIIIILHLLLVSSYSSHILLGSRIFEFQAFTNTMLKSQPQLRLAKFPPASMELGFHPSAVNGTSETILFSGSYFASLPPLAVTPGSNTSYLKS